MSLGSATFLDGLICTFGTGLGCNQFLASGNDDAVQFSLINKNDDGHGGHIVEQLADRTWIEIIGDASGRRVGSSIEATGKASIWRCPSSSDYPFPCDNPQGCKADMKLTLTRQ